MSTVTSNRRHHLAVLLLAVGLLAVAMLLRIDDSGRVNWMAAPPSCVWQRSVGFDCPFCGLTRCFVSAARGRLGEAWRFHPAGVLLFLVVAAQLPYRTVQLRRLARAEAELNHPTARALAWLLAAAFVLAWLAKVHAHFSS